MRPVDEEGLEGDPELTFTKILPVPAEFENIVTGGCEIDGKRVSIWRELDGVKTAIPEEELAKMREKYGTVGWYDWCTHNWGTKWDAVSNAIRNSKSILPLTISFETAWSPPIKVVKAWVAAYPALSFYMEYHESGMGVRGTVTCDGFGAIIVEEVHEYNPCAYCGGLCDEYTQEELDDGLGCDGYVGDIDGLYASERKDKVKEPGLRGGQVLKEDE